jgi:hypothetical protein
MGFEAYGDDDTIGWRRPGGTKRDRRVGGEEEGEDTLRLPLIHNLAESVIHGAITDLPACQRTGLIKVHDKTGWGICFSRAQLAPNGITDQPAALVL